MEYELSEIFTLDMVTVSRCNKYSSYQLVLAVLIYYHVGHETA